MPKKVITPEWEKYIRRNRLKMSAKEMAAVIGCSESPVGRYLRINNLQVPPEIVYARRAKKLSGRTKLTPAQDKIIKKRYLEVPVKTLAAELGVSDTCLRTRLRVLGLEIPPRVKERNRKMGRFKKGMKPANTGKKQQEFMSREAIERTKSTRFKPGQKPHTHMPGTGHISVRRDKRGCPYQFYKVADSRWVLYHRHLWEQAHGPVPKGHIVTFKNGDSMDCRLENLEIITRGQNATRNKLGFVRLPSTLRKAISLKNKLEKSLKNHG